MPASNDRYFLMAVIALVGATGCATGGTSHRVADPDRALERLDGRLETSRRRLVGEVETLRDREFDEPPSFVPVREIPSRTDNSDRRKPARKRRHLARFVFGRRTLPRPSARLFADLARYRPDDHQILFRSGAESTRRLEVALVAALADALESRHFELERSSDGIDRSLTRVASRRADEMLVAAAYLLKRTDATDSDPNPVRTIAQRPDVARKIPPLDGQTDWTPGNTEKERPRTADLRRRLTSLYRLGALNIGAALYRAGGWSGVELLYDRPPTSTIDLFQPERWMRGEGLGTWQWPAADGRSRAAGQVGPLLAAALVGGPSARDADRVLEYWQSDSFRVLSSADSDDNGSLRFEWIVQWSAPSHADQLSTPLAEAFEAAHGDRMTGDVRWSLVRDGLNMGFAAERGDSVPKGESPNRVPLTNSKVEFRTRQQLPVSYVPDRRESFRDKVRNAEIREGIWRDPASQLQIDLAAVKGWTLRSSRTLPLRWFAKRGEQVLMQLSTELVDPVAPEFGTDAYRNRLAERFSDSLEASEVGEIQTTDTPVPETLTFSVTGTREDRDWRIAVWQFRHGDVVATLSLQARAERFDELENAANRVLSSIETRTPPPGPSDSDTEDSGPIDYEIEENEAEGDAQSR